MIDTSCIKSVWPQAITIFLMIGQNRKNLSTKKYVRNYIYSFSFSMFYSILSKAAWGNFRKKEHHNFKIGRFWFLITVNSEICVCIYCCDFFLNEQKCKLTYSFIQEDAAFNASFMLWKKLNASFYFWKTYPVVFFFHNNKSITKIPEYTGSYTHRRLLSIQIFISFYNMSFNELFLKFLLHFCKGEKIILKEIFILMYVTAFTMKETKNISWWKKYLFILL